MRAALFLAVCAGCYDVDSLSANFAASDLSLSPVDDLGSRADLSTTDAASDASAVAVWVAVQSPVSANLRGLAADGNDVYAVGASSTILHIAADDTISAENPGPGFNLRGAASAGGEVWAVGDDEAVLVRSANWANLTAPGEDTLYGAFGLSASEFVAVGSGGHFERSRMLDDTGVSVALFSVWARSRLELFVVGEGGTILFRGPDGGVPWLPLTSHTASDLHGVFGSGSTLFAAGAAGTLLRSDDGVTWSAETVATTADLFGVWQSGSEAFVVGDGGVVLHSRNGAWTVEHTGGPALRAVIGRSVSDVWAVGDAGTILRYHP